MFIFYGNFRYFWGFQMTLFCHRSRIHGSTQCVNLPICCLKSDMNSSLCTLNVLIAGKLFCLIFLCCNSFIFHICYCGCKEKKLNGLQIQYRTKSPHFWNNNFSCFQAKKTRNTTHQKSSFFLTKRVRAQCHMFWVSSGWVVAVS